MARRRHLSSSATTGPAAGGRRARGFTLIELLIGALIGLLSTLVIAKVFAFSEAQRRATSTGSDAQVNGALALYTIQRDAQMAGYGMTASLDALGCPIKGRFNGGDFAWTLAPAQITAGASGAPDSINFMSSASTRYSMPTLVIANHSRTATTFFASSTIGIAPGDFMIVVPEAIDENNWCSVFSVTGVAAGNRVMHESGVAWNPPAGQEIFPGSPPGNDGYLASSYLLSLGSFINRTYSVGAGNALQLTSFDATSATSSTVELYPGIVQLQAFYGKDTDGDGAIDGYDKVAPTTNAGWRQVIAVRIALVARSAQYEKESVTAASPLWDVGTTVPVAGSATCGSSKCVTLQVNQLSDWQRYRYKVYDVIIPLRNLLWHA